MASLGLQNTRRLDAELLFFHAFYLECTSQPMVHSTLGTPSLHLHHVALWEGWEARPFPLNTCVHILMLEYLAFVPSSRHRAPQTLRTLPNECL